jgi:phosphate-selective porin OprO/OprP
MFALLAAIMLALFLSVASADAQAQTEQSLGDQQTVDGNLLDSTPDKERETEQAPQKPRIDIHENLMQTPADPDADRRTEDKEPTAPETSDEPVDDPWRPLINIQEDVPFLTKRNIVFFGRLELDQAHYSSGILKDQSGFDVRRFRLGLAGIIKARPGLSYKFEVDLTDSENTLSDAYLSWYSSKWGRFRLGNQKITQTLSGQTSSLSIPFMERPLPVLAFALQRRLGVGWDNHFKKGGGNVTIFGIDPNENIGSNGWAARAYFNPARSKAHVIHIGASSMQLSSDSDAQLRARPESHKTDIYLVDTGIWPTVDLESALGLEIASARGPVTFRGEYYRTDWSRSDASNLRFEGWYATASWFLTGEMARYFEGKFIRPNIRSSRGAWELALRYSKVNLNDENVNGGNEQNYTFGVNWYSKLHWRLMSNVIKVKSSGPFGEQDPWIVQFRVQYYF